MTDAIICFTTTGKESEAKKLAKDLVEKKLAACVQLIPKVTSFYMWKGALQENGECLMMIKSRAEQLAAMKIYIARHHSYDVPELLVVSAVDGLPPYLAWLEKATS